MNQIKLNNKVAVVTGGARGIGKAICQRFADSGAKVSIWDVDQDTAREVAEELPDASAFRVDLTDGNALAEATRQTLEQFGKIDILVNNAGITGMTDKTWVIPPEEWRRVVEVDLIGPYLACHHIVPHMLEQSSGRIVNVASIAGKEGNQCQCLLGSQSRSHRSDQVPGEGIGGHRHTRQLHHPSCHQDRYLRSNEPVPHRLHVEQDSHGTFWPG